MRICESNVSLKKGNKKSKEKNKNKDKRLNNLILNFIVFLISLCFSFLYIISPKKPLNNKHKN